MPPLPLPVLVLASVLVKMAVVAVAVVMVMVVMTKVAIIKATMVAQAGAGAGAGAGTGAGAGAATRGGLAMPSGPRMRPLSVVPSWWHSNGHLTTCSLTPSSATHCSPQVAGAGAVKSFVRVRPSTSVEPW